MKKKALITNYLLMLAVLFSILFQVAHDYEHLSKKISEKECLHKYNSGQEITHQHQDSDQCFACNFTINSFISSDNVHFEFENISIPSGYSFFKSREITQFFKGSLFALRAPPLFIYKLFLHKDQSFLCIPYLAIK